MTGPQRSTHRRALIVRLAQEALAGLQDPIVVDLGCDHGMVAAALGAIGTERRSSSLPARRDLPLVVADGLAPFERVDMAIATGMGAGLVLRLLASGPRPQVAVVHSPDRSEELRQLLKDQGWRIEAEALAPEGPRFAEVLRVRPGEQLEQGYPLWFGPKLLGDPLLRPHAALRRQHWAALVQRVPREHPTHALAQGWLHFLDGILGLSDP